MDKASLAFVVILSVWFGVAVGANLVAAPAKFTVTTLSASDLVSVGRAQFTYVGYLELVLAVLSGVSLFVVGRYDQSEVWGTAAILGVTILLLIGQRFYVHSALIRNSSDFLHTVYVVMELAKVIGLAGAVLVATKAVP